LLENKTKYVRPFSTKLRQGVFSVIGKKIIGSSVLDLFAGSGMCGIDALSRGARSDCMVDNNYEVIKNLYSEARKRDITNYIKIYYNNISRAMQKLHSVKKYYDIIFIDPPYNIRLQRDFWVSLKKILCSDFIIIYRTNHLDTLSNINCKNSLSKNIFFISNI